MTVGANSHDAAPRIGFGLTEPTSNAALTPADWGAAAEPESTDLDYRLGGQALKTAWWEFVAETDGWVSVDAHGSTTDPAPWEGFEGPLTQLDLWVRGGPRPESWVTGNLWQLDDVSRGFSPEAGPVWAEGGGLTYPYRDTSQLVFKAVAGWTYLFQLGMLDDYPEVTTYVLNVRPLAATPREIVVPAVGPFTQAPSGGATGSVTIVGGDDALTRESAGYIELGDELGGGSAIAGRYRGFSPSLENRPDWPPPANARHPQTGFSGLQVGFRYYVERTANLWWRDANVEGLVDGEFAFYYAMTHYPTINGRYTWDPDAPAQAGDRDGIEDGTWVWTGTYDSSTDPEVSVPTAGPSTLDEGINYGVNLTPSEVFLVDGESREVSRGFTDAADAIERWYEWSGDWYHPPFNYTAYQISPTVVGAAGESGTPIPAEQLNWTPWSASTPLGTGLDYAQHGWGLRIHWFEWVIRWISFDDVSHIEGQQVAGRQAFGDA